MLRLFVCRCPCSVKVCTPHYKMVIPVFACLDKNYGIHTGGDGAAADDNATTTTMMEDQNTALHQGVVAIANSEI